MTVVYPLSSHQLYEHSVIQTVEMVALLEYFVVPLKHFNGILRRHSKSIMSYLGFRIKMIMYFNITCKVQQSNPRSHFHLQVNQSSINQRNLTQIWKTIHQQYNILLTTYFMPVVKR